MLRRATALKRICDRQRVQNATFTLTNFTTLPRVDFICPWEYFFQLSDLSYSSHDTKYSVRPKSQSSSSLHWYPLEYTLRQSMPKLRWQYIRQGCCGILCEKHIYLIGGLSFSFGKRGHRPLLTCCLLHNNFTSSLKCKHMFVIIEVSLMDCDNG